MRIVYSILIVAALYTLYNSAYAVGRESVQAELDEVKSVCDKSSKVVDGALEEECGRLQDETGTYYMCGDYGCWLEVR